VSFVIVRLKWIFIVPSKKRFLRAELFRFIVLFVAATALDRFDGDAVGEGSDCEQV
jgi:hypothetical protein